MKKFARVCSRTGEGMNKGFCFGDGQQYFKYERDALEYAKEMGYESLQEAFDDEAYYWTEWTVEEGDTYYDLEGNEYENK